MILIFTCLYRVVSGRPLSVYRILLLKTNNTVTFYSWETLMPSPLPRFKPPVRWLWKLPPSGTFCSSFIWRDILWFSPWTHAAATGIINSQAITIFHFKRLASHAVFLPLLSSLPACCIWSPLHFLAATGTCFAAQLNFSEPANKISIWGAARSALTCYAKRPLRRKDVEIGI